MHGLLTHHAGPTDTTTHGQEDPNVPTHRTPTPHRGRAPSTSTMLTISIWRMIAALAVLLAGHQLGSLHYDGDTVDFRSLGGHVLTGRDNCPMIIVREMAPELPSGSYFGQIYEIDNVNGQYMRRSCSANVAVLPPGLAQFADTCTYLHIQVHRNYP
jgi:hypothetical protein